MRSEYAALAAAVGKSLKDPMLGRALQRSLTSAGASHCASLRLLIKPHKAPVTLRNVHRRAHSACESMSIWVAQRLELAMAPFKHFL